MLAAGAGRRYGLPKALATSGGEPWVVSTLRRLRDAGCSPLIVVVGAAAEQVRVVLSGEVLSGEVLSGEVLVVENPEWASGMASSLRVGLRAAATSPEVAAVVVMPVDVPGVSVPMIERVLAAVPRAAVSTALVQAHFDGVPGHPVLLGRDHWAAITAVADGDVGARNFLADHPGVLRIAVGPAAAGADVDWSGAAARVRADSSGE